MTMANSDTVTKQIVAIRDKWHTKNHPFFRLMLDGSLDLQPLGVYMASHYKFVELALPSFGFLLWKGPQDVKHAVIENLAEEEGLVAIPRPGHVAHDHTRMIFDFCNAAGLTDGEVKTLNIGPAWHGRRLHYVQTMRDEPLGVILAMQATQEGQQPALNKEITIPSFVEHYGFSTDSKEIAFFVEHAEADEEHSERQMALCEKYIDSPSIAARALEICEEACMLRWESVSEIYKTHVLKEERLLPPGMAA
jgi:pyrroloquinoline quinone (PQQ) biosynthesis protein C